MKFNIQDRIVLDEMVDAFTEHFCYNCMLNTIKQGKIPIITATYWLHMIQEVQHKIDLHTTKKALKQSKLTR